MSRVPAPNPLRSMVMGGIGPNPEARAARSAAPVGVVSSTPRSIPRVGAPTLASSSTTAGAGFGQQPMGSPHHARARDDDRAVDDVDVEHLERRAGADDVDDGVEAPDLVEVHLLRWAAVQPPLCLRQRREHRQCPLPHAARAAVPPRSARRCAMPCAPPWSPRCGRAPWWRRCRSGAPARPPAATRAPVGAPPSSAPRRRRRRHRSATRAPCRRRCRRSSGTRRVASRGEPGGRKVGGPGCRASVRSLTLAHLSIRRTAQAAP